MKDINFLKLRNLDHEKQILLLEPHIVEERKEVFENLYRLIRANEVTLYELEETVNDQIESLQQSEEYYFSCKLSRAEDECEYQKIIDASLQFRAMYGAKMQQVMQEFLDEKISITLNEKGEEVYNFDEIQAQIYDTLVNIKNDFDFLFRYQIYRVDVKQAQNC